jgi:hypothetical protein
MKNQFDGEEIEAGEEEREKLGGRGQRRLAQDSAAPPFFCKCLFFFFCRFLVMVFF